MRSTDYEQGYRDGMAQGDRIAVGYRAWRDAFTAAAHAEYAEQPPPVGTVKDGKMYIGAKGGWVDFWSNPTFTESDIKNAREAGKAEASERIAERDANTKKLLNELYHDRSRLEKIVANAVKIMKTIENFQVSMQSRTPENALIIGTARQFVLDNE